MVLYNTFKHVSPIALNLNPLRGDFDLLAPLLDLVTNRKDYQAKLYHSEAQEVVCGDLNASSYQEDTTWEAHRENKDLVLIFGKRGFEV